MKTLDSGRRNGLPDAGGYVWRGKPRRYSVNAMRERAAARDGESGVSAGGLAARRKARVQWSPKAPVGYVHGMGKNEMTAEEVRRLLVGLRDDNALTAEQCKTGLGLWKEGFNGSSEQLLEAVKDLGPEPA